MTKEITRVEHTFEGCEHSVKRKETEPAPSECPFCREIRRKAAQ